MSPTCFHRKLYLVVGSVTKRKVISFSTLIRSGKIRILQVIRPKPTGHYEAYFLVESVLRMNDNWAADSILEAKDSGTKTSNVRLSLSRRRHVTKIMRLGKSQSATYRCDSYFRDVIRRARLVVLVPYLTFPA